MAGSLKLKQAIAMGKVEVLNNASGETRVFLLDKNNQQFFIDIPPKTKKVLAPKLCPLKNILKSRNLGTLLRLGKVRLV